MLNQSILVKTELLNSVIDSNSWVYVGIGDKYVRKKASDLQPGDLVAIHNEGIHKTLKEVEPVLIESLRYRLAKETLHGINKDGKDIKNLRILLLRGLNSPTSPDLEARIMQENGLDFTPGEYATFNFAVLTRGVTVGEHAVYDWLQGRTLAPKDWNNFSVLAELNPEFKAIANSFGKDIGFYASYQLYVGIRRTIMNYIAQRTGQSQGTPDNGEDDSQPSHGKYAKEIEMVVGRFIKEVDRTKSAARVRGIREIEYTREPVQSESPEPHLKKGIYLGKLDKPLIDMTELARELHILNHTLINVIDAYCPHAFADEQNPMYFFGLAQTFKTYAAFMLNPREIAHAYSANINLIALSHGLKREVKDLEKLMEATYQKFLGDLRDGKVDEIANLPANTTSHLVDIVSQYVSALPKSYFEFQLLNTKYKLESSILDEMKKSKEPKNSVSEQESKIRNLEKARNERIMYMERTYSLRKPQKAFLLVYMLEQLRVHKADQVIQLFDYPEEELKQIKNAAERQGQQFYTRFEVARLLRNYGLPGAIRLFDPKNFVSDMLIV